MIKTIFCTIITLLIASTIQGDMPLSAPMLSDASPQPRNVLLLTDLVIHHLDGKFLAIDGNAVKDIIIILLKLGNIHYGKDLMPSMATGYEYNGSIVSISKLAAFEEKIPWCTGLMHCCESAKNDFVKITFHLLENMKQTKPLVIKLMVEDCTRRSKEDSFMLTWAKTNGNEEVAFRSGITNIRQLHRFLTDLTDFLFDLMYSCPKGCSQFKQKNQKLHKLFARCYPKEAKIIFG